MYSLKRSLGTGVFLAPFIDINLSDSTYRHLLHPQVDVVDIFSLVYKAVGATHNALLHVATAKYKVVIRVLPFQSSIDGRPLVRVQK